MSTELISKISEATLLLGLQPEEVAKCVLPIFTKRYGAVASLHRHFPGPSLVESKPSSRGLS